MSEPRTKAGRKFLHGGDMKLATVQDAIFAIEAEAIAQERERLWVAYLAEYDYHEDACPGLWYDPCTCRHGRVLALLSPDTGGAS